MIQLRIKELELKNMIKAGHVFTAMIEATDLPSKSKKTWWNLVLIDTADNAEYIIERQRGGDRLHGCLDAVIKLLRSLKIYDIDLRIMP